MSSENISNIPINVEEIENKFEQQTPIRMVRDISGTLVMIWNKSDLDDPRPSNWETILKIEADGNTLVATGHYVAIDPGVLDVREEISIPISPNQFRDTYEVMGKGKMHIPTIKIVELLQAVRRGVELYTAYKESTPEEQKEITYIEDEFPVNYTNDDAWKNITYMYGIRSNPAHEIVKDPETS